MNDSEQQTEKGDRYVFNINKTVGRDLATLDFMELQDLSLSHSPSHWDPRFLVQPGYPRKFRNACGLANAGSPRSNLDGRKTIKTQTAMPVREWGSSAPFHPRWAIPDDNFALQHSPTIATHLIIVG
jgi:hypothetical protein